LESGQGVKALEGSNPSLSAVTNKYRANPNSSVMLAEKQKIIVQAMIFCLSQKGRKYWVISVLIPNISQKVDKIFFLV
jgi:hypothetical protein